MSLDSGVSLGQLIVALVVVLLGGAVTWGGLLQRVKSLEKEVEALSGFDGRLIRIEERTGAILKTLEQITHSWLLKDPPAYDEIERPEVSAKPGRKAR